jgi:hypothetical protein
MTPTAPQHASQERKQFAYRIPRTLGERFQLYARYSRGMTAQALMEEVLEAYLEDKEITLPGG